MSTTEQEQARTMELMAAATRRELGQAELVEFNTWAAGDVAASGLDAVLGLEYTRVGPRGCATRVVVGRRHLQPWGVTNGGVYSSIGESAGSVSAFLAAGGLTQVVGMNNSTDFYRPSRAGDVIVSAAEPVHLGRTTQAWEIRHHRESDGKLLARTSLRMAVLGAG